MDEEALRLDLEERVGEAWGDVDMEGNGVLDADEIAQVLSALGEDELDEDTVFAELDEEGSGVIEWEAFSAWFIKRGVAQAAGEDDDDDDLGDLLDDLSDLGGSTEEEEAEEPPLPPQQQQQQQQQQQEVAEEEENAGDEDDSSVADAMADMDDLDLGNSDEDDDGEDQDDLLAGLDDLEGMSDFSDMSQDEDEDDRPDAAPKLEPAEKAQEQLPDSPSLVERMMSATAPEQPAEQQHAQEQNEQKLEHDEEVDGLNVLDDLGSVSDGLDGVSEVEPQGDSSPGTREALTVARAKGSAQNAAVEAAARKRAEKKAHRKQQDEVEAPVAAAPVDAGVSKASDLEGLRGAGLVGRRGNRFGQRSNRSVEELLVVDPNERSEEEVDVLHEWSRSIKGSFFAGLTSNALRKEVCRRLVGQTMAVSSVICREGEIGETFYVVVSGVVSVQVKGNEVATLRTGAAFGELSLTGDTDEARKRNATVVAKTTDVLLGTLDRGTYKALVATGWGSDLVSLRDHSRGAAIVMPGLEREHPAAAAAGSDSGRGNGTAGPLLMEKKGLTTGSGAPGELPDLSDFRAKRPSLQGKAQASVGPPPIPQVGARPRRSKSGTGPPPIPKGKGKPAADDGSKQEEAAAEKAVRAEVVVEEEEAAKSKLAEEEAARAKLAEEEEAAQLLILAEDEEAQLRFLAEEEAAAAAEAEAEEARLAQEVAAAAAVEAQVKANQKRIVAEAEAARVAKAQEAARAREEAETVSALREEMNRLCTEGSIGDLNDILSAAEEFAEHVPIEIEQVSERIEWLEVRLSTLNGLVESDDFGAVTAGIEDYDDLPGECSEAYERLLNRCDELLQRAHATLTALLDRGPDLTIAEIDAAIDLHADYSADDDVDQLTIQLLERRDELEAAAQAEVARISQLKAAEEIEREQAAVKAAEEQKRLQEEDKQRQAEASVVAEEKKLADAMASAVAPLDNRDARAAREEIEMQLLEQMDDLAQEAIEAYLEGVDHTHPFKVMSQEPEFVKQLATTLEERVLSPGELLITKGAVGDAMYFIMEGNADVLAELDEPPLAVLGPNSFCGEEALMLEAPRNAYVRASGGNEEDTALVVLELSKDDLMFVLDDWPALMEIIMTPMADRTWGSLEKPELEAETLDVVEEGVEEEDPLEVLEAQTEAEREAAEAEPAAVAAATAADKAAARAQEQAQADAEAEVIATRAKAEAEAEEAAAQAVVDAATASAEARLEAEQQQAAEAALAEMELEAIAELDAQSSDTSAIENQQSATSNTEIPEGRPRKRLSTLVPPPRVGAAAPTGVYRSHSVASLAPTSWLHNLLPLSELQAQVAHSDSNAQTGHSNVDEGADAGSDARWADLHMERCFPRCWELCQEMALASPRMSRNDTAIEVHAGATMGRASFALLRAYPNLGSVLLQEEQRTRLAVALERVEAAHTRHVGPELLGNDDRYGGGGGGVVRPLNKHLAAVALQADAMGGFTLAISALGLVPHDSSHSRMSLERPDDAQQKMLRNVRTALRQIYAMLAAGGHVILGECETSSELPDSSSTSISFSAFTLMRLMEEIGYTDVDLSWKRDGFFVCGGRKPTTSTALAPSRTALATSDESHDF